MVSAERKTLRNIGGPKPSWSGTANKGSGKPTVEESFLRQRLFLAEPGGTYLKGQNSNLRWNIEAITRFRVIIGGDRVEVSYLLLCFLWWSPSPWLRDWLTSSGVGRYISSSVLCTCDCSLYWPAGPYKSVAWS